MLDFWALRCSVARIGRFELRFGHGLSGLPRARRRRGENGFESLARRTVARRRSKKWLRNFRGNCPGYSHSRCEACAEKTLRNVGQNAPLKKKSRAILLRNRLTSEALRRNEPLRTRFESVRGERPAKRAKRKAPAKRFKERPTSTLKFSGHWRCKLRWAKTLAF